MKISFISFPCSITKYIIYVIILINQHFSAFVLLHFCVGRNIIIIIGYIRSEKEPVI